MEYLSVLTSPLALFIFFVVSLVIGTAWRVLRDKNKSSNAGAPHN